MTGIDTLLSIIALYTDDLSSPIKRHRLAVRTRKQDPSFCASKKNVSPLMVDTLREKSRKRYSKQIEQETSRCS